ncbi:MAG: hypothetical protein ACLFPE_09465 [Bacteroidales bacterium]
MKLIIATMLGALFMTFTPSFAQNDCKVMMAEIDSIYEGKCKRGYAHGQGMAIGEDRYEGKFRKGMPHGLGTYTWSTGEIYTGHFVEGELDGEGIYTYKSNGNDTTITGIWERNEYMGPIPEKPKVHQQISIDRINFNKLGDTPNQVVIAFMQNGRHNTDIENLLLTADSGFDYELGQSRGFREVKFPVTVSAKYNTWNKMRTRRVYSSFEFIISEPGNWQVDVIN